MIRIAEKIEKYIREYNKVVVLGPCTKDILPQIVSQQATGKVLLLVSGRDQDRSICGTATQAIKYEEYCKIAKLYHLYEFSDRICIVADNEQYGCLDNYVSNGLLTEEEALMALLQ